MVWEEFQEACPKLAKLARKRFVEDQLAMLGALREDGSPRISPCEVDFGAGHLFLGMMWRSPKALDLLRDPRITVHSVTTNKDGTDGDVKIYGRAIDIKDPALRATFREAILERINWAPDEPKFHLFSVDVESASHTIFGGGQQRIMAWTPTAGLREWSKKG